MMGNVITTSPFGTWDRIDADIEEVIALQNETTLYEIDRRLRLPLCTAEQQKKLLRTKRGILILQERRLHGKQTRASRRHDKDR